MTITSPLKAAQTLHANLELAQAQLEGFLRDTLQSYIDFLPERGSAYVPAKYTKASDFTFKGLETTPKGQIFIFESEEFYEYGDYERDIIELPSDFIEDPEAFMTRIRKEIADAAALLSESQRERARKEVLRLEAQLEAAKKRAVLL